MSEAQKENVPTSSGSAKRIMPDSCEANAELPPSGKPLADRTATAVAAGDNAGATKESTTSAGPKKKRAAKGDGKKDAGKKKKLVRECVEECNPGPNNPCWQQRKGRRGKGKLSCTEVYDKLQELGMSLEDIQRSSKCALSAIMKGYIDLNKDGASLDMQVYELNGYCEHRFTATLRQVLEQTDHPGPDYGEPTLYCKEFNENECIEGHNFASRMCSGKPVIESGKFHNHCDECPGFGRCIGDYRNSCYKRGVHTTKVHFLARHLPDSSDSEDFGLAEEEEDGSSDQENSGLFCFLDV
eukprot:TRINITY_DN18394_c0_g2_i1.p1 TRINITY_DN18394_c0_g2~~TRINITY_DN18394_c0_g2_i1.p1  ORF type:complete len:307 (-),score=89.58 TRINITY_DN18394_c0_g2_i1:134-1027(-)